MLITLFVLGTFLSILLINLYKIKFGDLTTPSSAIFFVRTYLSQVQINIPEAYQKMVMTKIWLWVEGRKDRLTGNIFVDHCFRCPNGKYYNS